MRKEDAEFEQRIANKLDESQMAAVLAMKDTIAPIVIIQAPPGTGKTRTAVHVADPFTRHPQ